MYFIDQPGQLSYWQLSSWTRLMYGISSLSTNEPNPIWKSLVILWIVVASFSPNLTCTGITLKVGTKEIDAPIY